jgi:hypothetical protein
VIQLVITISVAGPAPVQTLLAHIILPVIANITVVKVTSNALVANVAGKAGENLNEAMLALAFAECTT